MRENKTIAKNSLFLYLRTFLTTVVALYTSRVFLKALGIEDYGLYVLVGGVISFFTITQGWLAQATQRFLNIEIGKKDFSQENKIFDVSLVISFCLLLIVLVLGETIGLWFLLSRLNIPESKESIAFWTYQFSLLTTAISLLKVPYHAYIIAHERMSFYAYMAIFEVTAKLLVTLSLFLFVSRLIIYALLYLIVNIISLLIYRLYCKKRIGMMKFSLYNYKKNQEYKDLLSFSAFSLLGYGAGAVRDQGLGIIFNIFRGVTLNAACGLADQINAVYTTLFQNIQVAFMPQIVQNSVANVNRFEMLIKYSCLSSFVLMGVVCIPMIANANYILHLWLGPDIPPYTDIIVQVYMIKILVVSMSQALFSSLVAVKRIKESQIWMSILCVATTAFMWMAMKWGAHPVIAIALIALMDLVVMGIRLYYMSVYTSISLTKLLGFIKRPLINTFMVFTPLAFYISLKEGGFIFCLANVVLLLALYIVTTYFCLDKQLRTSMLQRISSRLH